MLLNKNYVIGLMLIVIFTAGCESCDTRRSLLKENTLTTADNKIDPKAKPIKIGMTKEDVIKVWGEPRKDYINPRPGQPSIMEYSNYYEGAVKQAESYSIFLIDGKVTRIVEYVYDEFKYICIPIK